MIHALHLSLHGAVSHLAVVHGWGLLLALAVHLAMVHAARFALHGTMIHLAVIHALHRRFGGTVAHLAVVHRHGAVPHCRMIHFLPQPWVTPPLSALSDTASAMRDGRENLVVMVRTCFGFGAAMLIHHLLVPHIVMVHTLMIHGAMIHLMASGLPFD